MKEEKVISKSPGTATEDNIIEFPITNDIVFNLVMQDPEISRQLLERIFPDKKIGEIRLINDEDEDIKPVTDKSRLFDMTTQFVVENGISAKGIRLDVFMIDDNEWYDVEMQCGNDMDLPKRSRYYHSAVDVAMLHKGEEYSRLKPSYVIFICTFDLFGKDMPVYRFEMICKDKTDLKLGDETCTIFLNTICTRKTVPEGLSKLFRYISNMECCDDDLFISELHERVRELNTAERRKVLHTLEDKINERYRAGFSEGKDAGFS